MGVGIAQSVPWVLLACGGALACEPRAASPSEPPPARAGGALRECLAETYPILAESVSTPRSEVVALDADGRSSRRVASEGYAYGGVWAPDGRSLAFRRRDAAQGSALGVGRVAAQLALASSDGDSPDDLPLVLDDAPAGVGLSERFPDAPSWSPDGSAIAFASQRESDRWRIWEVSSAGGRPRLLLPDLDAPHYFPSRSPAAPDRLAYVAELEGQIDLWLSELDSGAPARNLTRGALLQIESPRWSADGAEIAFSGALSANNDRRDLFVVDVESSELTRLSEGVGSTFAPIWAPEEGALLVTSTRPEQEGGPQVPGALWKISRWGEFPPELLTGFRSRTISTDWFPGAACAGSGS